MQIHELQGCPYENLRESLLSTYELILDEARNEIKLTRGENIYELAEYL